MKNPLSLEAFADWLGTMPADEEYNYTNNKDCAVAQFLKSIDAGATWVGSITWCDAGGAEHNIPEGLDKVAGDWPHTFGDAHRRARIILAQRPS